MLRCFFVETLKMFQAFLVVVLEDVLLSLGENKGSKTTKEFRGTIEKLYPERSSRVAAVSSSKTSWEYSPESIVVGRDSGEDVWEVSMDRPQNANMLSFIREGDHPVAKPDWRDKLPVSSSGIHARGSKAKKFCLLRDKLNMILFTVLNSKLEEMLQLEYAVTDNGSVIGLADGGDTDVVDEDPKLGELGSGELLVVGQLVKPVAQDSTLLHTKLVKDGSHETLVHSTKVSLLASLSAR